MLEAIYYKFYKEKKGWGGRFPCSSVSKESACNAGDLCLILGQEDPLEKEIATHSIILAWRIPWTEEPGRFPVFGVARIGHKLATKPLPLP